MNDDNCTSMILFCFFFGQYNLHSFALYRCCNYGNVESSTTLDSKMKDMYVLCCTKVSQS